jgi:outer membrane protein assembly factor BamB
MKFEYRAPLQSGAPWPTFRRTIRNRGYAPIRAEYQGDEPWFFQTGKGIFSTPIVDEDGIIYFGSADHNFYAINPDGREKWRFRTGEIIDSAGALPADQPGTVLVPSGDGFLYRLNTQDGREVWRFDARLSPRDSYNNWFEANISIGPNGTIYAGNTNFNYYAITSDGQLRWTYETGANAWSAAAFGPDGRIYWGSCDTFFHCVSPEGRKIWKRRTLGFVSASAAIGLDGTVYAGSFDSNFYALDPLTGKTRWKFKANDHIYGSAALLEVDDRTLLILFGSAGGILYALNPNGELQWQYDTGAPIRSSPVIGNGPEGEESHIVYFGNGDGKLFALDAQSGRKRWSYDTTGAGQALPDRNDLNGSPALGLQGIYIGGEHGQLWYVPYDYPLHQPEDPRGNVEAAGELPEAITTVYYVSPGGRALPKMPAKLPAATLICMKLVVRKAGQTLPARFHSSPFFKRPNALQVSFDPPLPFRTEVSGNGKYLTIIPEDFLEPGTEYRLSISGSYYQGGINIGNLTLGGRSSGAFKRDFTFVAETPAQDRLPLQIHENEVSAFEWTRLAVPIPTMLPSLNQIGFDYMDWLIGPVLIDQPDAGNSGKVVLWATGAKRGPDGVLVADAETDFRLPLSGRYQDDAFIVSNRHFEMAITGIPIPFQMFQLRGRMGADGQVLPGATAFAETKVLSIPTFGIPMIIAGLANEIWKKLLAMATYITKPYPAGGPANRRPAGVHVQAVDFSPPSNGQAGHCTATIQLEEDCTYPVAEHQAAILLVDRQKRAAVDLDYHNNLELLGDELGNLRQIRLTLPKGKQLPEKICAYVILDVFPIHHSKLDQ